MKKTKILKYIIRGFIVGIAIFAVSGFFKTYISEPKTVTIRQIAQNLSYYKGRIIIIKGKYWGWGLGPHHPPTPYSQYAVATKSDWTLEDEEGSSISVTNKGPDMFVPIKPEYLGREVIVKGVVKLGYGFTPYHRKIKGAYIKALEVRIVK